MVDEPMELNTMASCFYKQLYTAKLEHPMEMDVDGFPAHSHVNWQLLNHSASLPEVKAIVFQMGAHKVHSLNGLLSMFLLEILGHHQKMCVAIRSTCLLLRKLSGADKSYSIALILEQDTPKLI